MPAIMPAPLPQNCEPWRFSLFVVGRGGAFFVSRCHCLLQARPILFAPKARLHRGAHWTVSGGSSEGHALQVDLSRYAVNALEVADRGLQGLRAPSSMGRISAIRTRRG